jgi:hypothetical protein
MSNEDEQWLFPEVDPVIYGSPECDAILAERAELQAMLERSIPSLIEKYGLPADDLSVLFLKRVLGAYANKIPGKRHRRVTLSKHRRATVHRMYQNKCAMCRRADQPLTLDHIIPLASGGCNAACNLQVLCYQCNADKGILDMTDWLESRAANPTSVGIAA